ncbi:dihydroorotate dehydrogenase-like protein [Natronogracilivirga saccharolytica]|uniref:Dihydroorotate dehydrogenase-like protein n=1 Tax=Natronogracilivirga saccharolytica TaxID=2812953 RepID=A0A8J7S6R5_9BACT|nr:dihydroorotate dehydrogenase-like protein [Natronogracilivirga saccharolytica]MBP3191288.1 dihydroorotate dehydrogenase-like protein [Natronogracilivirga saccharolytica]
MNLETNYLGLKLKSPLVPSASPLSSDLGKVKRMEDAGASAIVMYSLFEEQITKENRAMDHFMNVSAESYAEALSYFPEPEQYHNLEAEDYLEHIRKIKETVDIPVIGSLNGISEGGWMSYAKKMEDAGADALELNIYYVAADPDMTSDKVEQMYIDDLKAVKENVSIPVSIKLGPYFSAFANMAKRLEAAGADGLVLFNRFYQPDIDLETKEVAPSLELSNSFEKRLPLRWIAMLRPHIKASLAATTGIHSAEDVIKMLMVGADVTMMTSALLREGCDKLYNITEEMKIWMNENEYASVEELKGCMSSASVADATTFERANYIRILQSYKMDSLG